MSQNYAMPPLTPEEAQQVIDMCESTLAMHAPHTIHAKQALIALAALTAEQVLSVEVIQKNERLRGFNFHGYEDLPAGLHYFYDAPPAPVLRLPEYESSIDAACDTEIAHNVGWNACIDWVKRMNEVKS